VPAAGPALSWRARACHHAGMADGRSDATATDFAVAVYREDGQWVVASLPPSAAEGLEPLVHALRQQPAEGGAIGLVSVAEDFFVAVRVFGEDELILLSDVTAAHDWPLAREVLDRLGLPMPEGDELDQVQPAGDITAFADLGLPPMEIAMICEDPDLYPDEMLSSIASRLGFGEEFEQALDQVLG
jgi:putative tRNA adenosine deaminase-associated protein